MKDNLESRDNFLDGEEDDDVTLSSHGDSDQGAYDDGPHSEMFWYIRNAQGSNIDRGKIHSKRFPN